MEQYYDPPVYYNGELTYVQVPRLTFDPPFEELSDDARVFYGILLDRMEESYDDPERWSDNGEAFVYYRRTELMRFFNIAQQKATKIYKELENHDLIRRKRQSAERNASKIYINEYWEDPPPDQWERQYKEYQTQGRRPFKGPKRRMHNYINVYWILFTPAYKNLSNSARILYGLLTKQMNKDEKKGRLRKDRKGAYIYYTREEIMQVLRVSDKKATKTLCELEDAKLISRQRQGFGRPTKIRIILPKQTEQERPSLPRDEKYASTRDEKYASTSNNLHSPIYSINQSTSNEAASRVYTVPVDDTRPTRVTKEEIAEQVDRERLYRECPQYTAYTDSIIELIYDEVTSDAPRGRIGQATRARADIRARLCSLSSKDVQGVIERLTDLHQKPRNPRAYMLTSLYNAATTSDKKGEEEDEVAKYAKENLKKWRKKKTVGEYARKLKEQREKEKKEKAES